MASIAITSSIQRANSSTHHFTKKKHPQARPAVSFGSTPATHVVTVDPKVQKGFKFGEKEEKSDLGIDEAKFNVEKESCVSKFFDDKWKNGTWDLNLFVKNGKMDWDGVIVAEARRRKFLEVYPETSTNEDPVHFRTSIIPWWAWIMRSHLPEAELLNGRAAMAGFFMGYLVDALTGLDMIGQTGNIICKSGLFMTVIGIILFRRSEDFEKLQRLAEEATFYDKQWQASWQDQNASSHTSKKS